MGRTPLLAAVALLLLVSSCDGARDRGTPEEPTSTRVERTDPSPIVADFEFSVDLDTTRPTYCPSVAVRFTDTSSGDPTSWHWTFPDGSTSTEQHPTYEHGVDAPGDVTLTVRRGSESDSVTKTVQNQVVC